MDFFDALPDIPADINDNVNYEYDVEAPYEYMHTDEIHYQEDNYQGDEEEEEISEDIG